MKLSVVTTLYYSEDYVQEFYKRTLRSIGKITDDYEFIFVNDGSPDGSLLEVLAIQNADPRITVVDLSRNFGHHKAIMTGLRFAKGDYVFLIDSDLEESPELLETYWAEMQNNLLLDVVYGIQACRKGRWFERLSGSLFYKFFGLLTDINYPHNSLTARLMKSNYVRDVTSFKETEFDIWGIFVLTGYNQHPVTVSKGDKGRSTYNFYRKLQMAIEMVTSCSNRPLYLIFVIGCLVSFFSILNVTKVIFEKYYYSIEENGWTSTIASIWLIGGVIILLQGVMGIYLSKLFLEIKSRPYGIIKKIHSGDCATADRFQINAGGNYQEINPLES
jgi:putative glycosyltransferase